MLLVHFSICNSSSKVLKAFDKVILSYFISFNYFCGIQFVYLTPLIYPSSYVIMEENISRLLLIKSIRLFVHGLNIFVACNNSEDCMNLQYSLLLYYFGKHIFPLNRVIQWLLKDLSRCNFYLCLFAKDITIYNFILYLFW